MNTQKLPFRVSRGAFNTTYGDFVQVLKVLKSISVKMQNAQMPVISLKFGSTAAIEIKEDIQENPQHAKAYVTNEAVIAEVFTLTDDNHRVLHARICCNPQSNVRSRISGHFFGSMDLMEVKNAFVTLNYKQKYITT